MRLSFAIAPASSSVTSGSHATLRSYTLFFRYSVVHKLPTVIVVQWIITPVRDCDSCSSVDFVGSKFLFVAFLGLVILVGDQGQSDSLLLASEMPSARRPGGAGIDLVVSSS